MIYIFTAIDYFCELTKLIAEVIVDGGDTLKPWTVDDLMFHASVLDGCSFAYFVQLVSIPLPIIIGSIPVYSEPSGSCVTDKNGSS